VGWGFHAGAVVGARVLVRTKTRRGWTVRVLYDREYDDVTSDVCVCVCVLMVGGEGGKICFD